MEQIYDTRDKLTQFDFSKLVLSKPTLISGGNYFIRFKKNNFPLYIQPPSCSTRNGFVKNGRKYHTDLMFTNEDEYIIQWLERLEEYCVNFIYSHRSDWFDGDMEIVDIENYFTSPLKVYKSGKYYTVRVNIPSALDKPNIKIYDEKEEIVDFNSINDTTRIMSIMEVQGIKCSARSFQIELEMKQVLVTKPIELDLFNKCIITHTEKVIHETPTSIDVDTNNDIVSNKEVIEETMDTIKTIIEEKHDTIETIDNLGKRENIDEHTDTQPNDAIVENDDMPLTIENNVAPTNEFISSDTMQEVVFNLEDLSQDETVNLKQPNEVYYQMYKDAIQKAKIAREMALSSYLEAKNIKNTYMLTDIDDSDMSDMDMDDDSIVSEKSI
jgi:hypothetical protein